jgi:putative intracellular protease/amidase
MKNINVILFDGFTFLDVFGPVEVFVHLDKHFKINFFSQNGGSILTNPRTGIQTKSFGEIEQNDILLVPGGFGTRELVNDEDFIRKLKELANRGEYVLTVCTGSALLAKTGLLNNRNATSNKLAFDWVTKQGPEVNWIRKARWVVDGKYYTSSGVSAGIDMSLGFVSDTISKDASIQVSKFLEYIWNEDKDNDLFGK